MGTNNQEYVFISFAYESQASNDRSLGRITAPNQSQLVFLHHHHVSPVPALSHHVLEGPLLSDSDVLVQPQGCMFLHALLSLDHPCSVSPGLHLRIESHRSLVSPLCLPPLPGPRLRDEKLFALRLAC